MTLRIKRILSKVYAMNKQYPDVAILILCGGKSRRMQGQDKGLIEINGKPLVSYSLDTLSGQFDHIFISANCNLDTYASLGFEIFIDKLIDSGPLGGIHAGLSRIKQSWLLITPCDTPHISLAIAERLLKAAKEDDSYDVYVAHDGNRPQYLHALLSHRVNTHSNNLLESIELFLEKDKAVKNWYQTLNSQEVDCADLAEQFGNINTPEDLNEILRI